jgi:hypothetical protein
LGIRARIGPVSRCAVARRRIELVLQGSRARGADTIIQGGTVGTTNNDGASQNRVAAIVEWIIAGIIVVAAVAAIAFLSGTFVAVFVWSRGLVGGWLA